MVSAHVWCAGTPCPGRPSRPLPTALISKSAAIWFPWSSCEGDQDRLGLAHIDEQGGRDWRRSPSGSRKSLVGSPEQDRNPTATASTTEPRNKRFIVDTSVRRSVKDASRIVRLKSLAYAGVVPPAQAEQIDSRGTPRHRQRPCGRLRRSTPEFPARGGRWRRSTEMPRSRFGRQRCNSVPLPLVYCHTSYGGARPSLLPPVDVVRRSVPRKDASPSERQPATAFRPPSLYSRLA